VKFYKFINVGRRHFIKEHVKRVALYRAVRSTAQGGLNLTMIREVAKLLVRSTPLPDDLLGDLYPFEDRSDDGIRAYIDQAEYAHVELLLLDLTMGEHLSVESWDLDGADDNPGVDALNAMAQSEGIDPATDHRQAITATSGAAPTAVQPADPAEDAATPPEGAQQSARPKLQLKTKPAAVAAPTDGPVITVKKPKKDRSIALAPATAWPFPTQSRPTEQSN
jgi:hypothetical protein